uniref:Myosin, light chain kinase 5 n=1 Tax=Amphilophus citrinellus TaxID=61819 RepID=A0A3Q0RWK0_AMPCI
DMNADGSKQRYVSTFKTRIKAPCASPAAGNGSKYMDPPVFIEPLKDCFVDEGNDIRLHGVLTGSLPIKISWLHNGEVACFGKASFNGREVRFVVKECLPEDAGAYTCLAESSAGKTSCSAAVVVREVIPKKRANSSTGEKNTLSPHTPSSLPVFLASTHPFISIQFPCLFFFFFFFFAGQVLCFENPPQHLEVKVGQTARLTCTFKGCPPVASCWIRNKEQVPELQTEHTNRSSTLVIEEAKPHHAGRYTVVVKDRKSSAEHTVTLSVIERPQPPASGPVISLVSASSLVLSWSGPCYDGGSAILGYVVEVKNQGRAEPEVWSELTTECKSTSYRVSSGLQPQQEYCFRVKAYNAAGVSEPGPVSPVVRMEQREEAPRMYTTVSIDSAHKVTDHYNVQEKLGMGKFGMVYKLTHKETGCVCAGKFYKGRRAKEREAARKEIELMNYLHHPKLVQCLAAYDHKSEIVMVMEFIAGGELFERIVDDNFEHTEPSSVRYMQQILEGIAYMHQQSILHLDLKPENIVCVDTTGTSIKIIDFGLAGRLDKNTPLKVLHGTPEFVAPEVINYEPVCFWTDMWSIGVICYILLSGESPFQGNSDAETLALVTAAQWEFDEESFDEITEEAKNFISSLLNKDPRRRMSCEEALAHPWMAAFKSKGLASTKSLSKEKMKRFLARQKWKKAGKAMLALKRMALLSKADSSASPTKEVLPSLELKLQEPPLFTQSLEDQTATQGSSARLSCHLTGYPDPEVVWLCGDEPIEESSTVQIEYEEDGQCTLVLAKVGPEDTNVYTCRATNDHGEAFSSAKLTVRK